MVMAILHLLVNHAPSQDSAIKLKVVAEQANIRLKPDISSIIIRQVPKGTILNSRGKEGEWYIVLLASNEEMSVRGYVHESLVIVIEPLPEKKKRPVKAEEKTPVLPTETARATLPYRFSLAIKGGGNIISGGDLNQGIQGLAGLYGDIFGTEGEGNIDPIHLGYSIDIELIFPLSPQFSWGIGLGFLQGKNKSTVVFRQGSLSQSLSASPGLSAVPVSVFLSWEPLSYLYFRGGISYYFARCSYLYQIHEDDLTQEWEGRSNARGLGLMGVAGVTKKIAPSLSFVAEAMARLAKINGFTGKGTYKDETGQILTEEGKLYFIHNQVLESRIHNTLFIRSKRPNEAGIIEASEAKIDLSGFSLRIGLCFYF